jgi:drug/metabolite transporter (DMT)-like permease
MEILLALGAAVSYGTSDFTGGILARRTHVFVVVLLSQLVGTALLLAAVPFWVAAVSWPAVGWGAAAGLAGVVGTSLLYQGLALGRMSVVAPITGVVGAGTPVLFGLASGERPRPAALAGIVLGLTAVVIISRAPTPSATRIRAHRGEVRSQETRARSRRSVIDAFGAGLGFGLFFILLDRSPEDSGLWPLVATRVSMVASLGLVVAVGRVSVRTPAGTGLRLLGLGVINTVADLLYLLATRSGLLSLVALITSMYPAVTVGLAGLTLRERISGQQLAGFALAAVSVVLIALG